MNNLDDIRDAARHAASVAARAESVAQKAIAAAQVQADNLAMVRAIINLVTDAKASAVRFAEFDARLTKLGVAEKKLAADTEAHVALVTRERQEIAAERAKVADLIVKYKIERSAWDAGHYRRIADAEANVRAHRSSDLQVGTTLTRDARYADAN